MGEILGNPRIHVLGQGGGVHGHVLVSPDMRAFLGACASLPPSLPPSSLSSFDSFSPQSFMSYKFVLSLSLNRRMVLLLFQGLAV